MNAPSRVLALAGLALALFGGAFLAGRCSGSSDATREAAQAVADSQARLVARLVKEQVAAELAQLGTRTVVREYLTRPTPPRPETPPDLHALTIDSLAVLVRLRDIHIDTLRARLDSVRVAYGRDTIASNRVKLLGDSTIAAQRRQIAAMQVVIDHPPKRSPIGVGATCGYGFVVGAAGPGCVGGVTVSVSLSSIWPF